MDIWTALKNKYGKHRKTKASNREAHIAKAAEGQMINDLEEDTISSIDNVFKIEEREDSSFIFTLGSKIKKKSKTISR